MRNRQIAINFHCGFTSSSIIKSPYVKFKGWYLWLKWVQIPPSYAWCFLFRLLIKVPFWIWVQDIAIFKMKTIFEKSSFYKKREKVFSSMEKIELKTMIKIKEKGRKEPSRKLRCIKRKSTCQKCFINRTRIPLCSRAKSKMRE